MTSSPKGCARTAKPTSSRKAPRTRIWALVSYVLGMVLVNPLNAIRIAGFPLGFWFANQGSEVIFVILIFVYVGLMSKLDREYDVHE